MLMVAGTTLACELIAYLVQVIIFEFSLEILPLVRILLIEVLYNSTIIIIIYPIIEKAGDILKRIFTEKSILAKYY